MLFDTLCNLGEIPQKIEKSEWVQPEGFLSLFQSDVCRYPSQNEITNEDSCRYHFRNLKYCIGLHKHQRQDAHHDYAYHKPLIINTRLC